MQTLTFYGKDNNLNLLHEQLLDAYPALRGPTDDEGVYNEPQLMVEGLGDKVTLTFPDEYSAYDIAVMVGSHDASGKSVSQKVVALQGEAVVSLAVTNFDALDKAIGDVVDPAVQASLAEMAKILHALAAANGLTKQEKREQLSVGKDLTMRVE